MLTKEELIAKKEKRIVSAEIKNEK